MLLGLTAMEIQSGTKLIVESDCAGVVKALTSRERDRSRWCAVLEEARNIIGLLDECQITKVRREANSVADALARDDRVGVECASIDICPAHVLELVMNDCKLLCARDI